MLQLYTLPTPNGQKISIALEELGLPYKAHRIDISKGEQFDPAFIKINPNSKIPALVDPDGPGGAPLSIMESGAILIYLAEKTGKLMSSDQRLRNETLQWLFFQVGAVGPMFGQFGHFFKYAKGACNHPYPVERYTKETRRLLCVLEARLREKGDWLIGDYSIADIATCPWVNCLGGFYGASDHLKLADFPLVQEWCRRFNERPAVLRGAVVGA